MPANPDAISFFRKNMRFGSKVELAQATLTNSLLVSGPNSRAGLN